MEGKKEDAELSPSQAAQPNQINEKKVFRVWDGLSLVAYITGFIIGPLIFIGGFGLWLDVRLGGRKILFFIFLAIAFVVSNLLVVRKSKEIMSRYK